MFDRDQPEIGAYARSSPDAMARVVTFVYLTIQQSIFTVKDMMRDVDLRGAESHHLWGFKLDAYDHMQDNKQAIYDEAMALWRSNLSDKEQESQLLIMWAGLPGLGLVKGGFVNQLVFGYSGCIDTHNLQLYEIDPQRFKASKFKAAKPARRSQLATEYNAKCYDIGGTDFLWDNWCKYVADRNKRTANEVSRLHVECIL